MSGQLFLLQMIGLQAIPEAESSTEPLWRFILSDIPHDAGAILVYALLLFSIGLIWWGNRKSSRPRRAA